MSDFEAFYDGLRTAAELPTTSQPSIGDFIEVYEPLVAAGHDIVSIHLSGALSAGATLVTVSTLGAACFTFLFLALRRSPNP